MNSRTQALEYSRMQECCDADLGARLWFFLSSWVLECLSSCLLKLFSPKSSRIPPSLRYGATFPGSRTRRSSKSEGGFRRSRRILLRHVRFRGRRRTGQNSSLFKRLQFAVLPLLHFLIL